MIPLWTTATPSYWCGWAFSSDGRPCVAQRVCPMPQVPRGISRRNFSSRFFSFPFARTTISDSSSSATPAES